MTEYEIAFKKVLPYLQTKLGWPKELVSAYGRVPIQVGISTVWADFVCYITQGNRASPWLLVEVKKRSADAEQIVPQAESYSLILRAPFFCVTDGEDFDFYITGSSQGGSIRLQSPPPTPSTEYLEGGVEYIVFPPQVDDLLDLFLMGLKQETKFLEDTRGHDIAVKRLFTKVFRQVDDLSSNDLKLALDKWVMLKPPNKNELFKQIDEDYQRVRRVLRFISDFSGDPVENLNRLLDKKGNLHLRGGGIFFITQLLAGAHPNEYVVLEENISRALRYLGVTDILVKNDTSNGYVYINEICKKLFKEKLEHRLKEYNFGLAAVHNFLWHYYVHYRTKKRWFP